MRTDETLATVVAVASLAAEAAPAAIAHQFGTPPHPCHPQRRLGEARRIAPGTEPGGNSRNALGYARRGGHSCSVGAMKAK